MEPQTLINLIFAFTTLLTFVVLLFVKTTTKTTTTTPKKAPPSQPVRDRESLTGDDDNYRGNPDDRVEVFGSVSRGDNNETDAAAEIVEDTPTYCDVLVHHNAANLPIPQFVRLANGYRADLVSGSSVMIDKLKRSETFCATKPVPNAYSSFGDPYADNAHHQWSSRMAELWYNNEYVAANKAKFRATADAVCYKSGDPYNSRMYVVRLLRVVDKQEFYYVHFTQSFKNSYTDDLSYTALVQALNTLKRFHSDGEYVIVGNFNVHGHEAVFRHHLPGHYAVCDFRTVPTSMDVRCRGIASPDGLVVSTRIYEAIEYHTVMSDLNATNGALVLLAALYIKHPHDYKGSFVSEHWPLQYMMDDLSATLAVEKEIVVVSNDGKAKRQKRVYYYDEPSSFDPGAHATDALMSVSDLKATCAIADAKETPSSVSSLVEPISSNTLLFSRAHHQPVVAEPVVTTVRPNTPPPPDTSVVVPAKSTTLTGRIQNRFTRGAKKDRSTPPPTTIVETPEPSAPPIDRLVITSPSQPIVQYSELNKDLDEFKKGKH